MKKRSRTTISDWVVVAVALLDDVAAIFLVLLALWYFKIETHLAIIIAIGLALGTFALIVHRAVIPSLHNRRITGSEAMIGRGGRVIEPLKPVGMVRVGDEYWQARSVNGDMTVGEEVEVVGVNHLTLNVKHKGSQ